MSGTKEPEDRVEEKSIVQILAEQKKEAAVKEKKMKVSPLKLVKENDRYKLSKRKCWSEPVTEAQRSKKKVVGGVSRAQSRCPHCGKQFPLGGAWKLKKHILKEHHEVENEKSCSICLKRLSLSCSLAAHMEMHKELFPWVCRPCGGKFENLTQFVKHVKSRHQFRRVDQAMDAICI